jgi:hypothetical protein
MTTIEVVEAEVLIREEEAHSNRINREKSALKSF